MDQEKLSAKQQEIYDFIKDWTMRKSYPPTVRDICAGVDLKSTSSVHAHLATLERKGYIHRDPTKTRAIEIIDDQYQMMKREELASIPVVGRVAAGAPILATENIESYFPFPADYMPQNPAFMLRVKGTSMINAGINNGDLRLVEEQKTARNGDIVVAMIDDSATVKRFYREKGYIRLQPENDSMDPIIVKDHLQIIGKVFGVLRLMEN